MRRSLWVIPPLLGIAGYFAAASGGNAVGSPAGMMARASERPEPPTRSDVGAVLAELEQTVEARRNQEALELSKFSAEALREEILKLKQRQSVLTKDSDWNTVQRLGNRLYAAAQELGKRQGAEAIAWLQGTAQELSAAAMDGWAEVEPQAAFKAIIASDRRGPCRADTLMSLLQGKAEAGGATLKQACAQVPWELFRDLPGDPFQENDLWIPEDADLQPWLESGAARELAAQGVGLTNLFNLWARRDPRSALIQSLDWPPEAGPQTLFVLGVGLDSPESAERIRAVLEGLPEDQFSKVREAVSKHRETNRSFGNNVVEAFPMLDAADESGKDP